MKIYNGVVHLYKNSIGKTFQMHRLILYAFSIPNPESKETVDHINSNYKDNRLSNLRWATPKEQMANEETRKKICYTVQITYPDKTKKTFVGLKKIADELKTTKATIGNYLSKDKPFNGHILKKIEVAK